ncbi:alpha/beta fold hydrolase [Acrocarpospora catenulata]|uniref:alpha/beta fold hydrolase n=1 Tax=Acrocarpospora catenulata TaxID=2836182 RepID=UPI002023B685|nr:alpha/beta hydrolase [Acrocarpospora catenulata]
MTPLALVPARRANSRTLMRRKVFRPKQPDTAEESRTCGILCCFDEDGADKVFVMSTFSAYDGTKLAYHVSGEGLPLVCLPGGPMQDSDYLGELGGLSAHRQLVLVDPRGTGLSAIPQDTSSYRCDRLVDDVEALREHLGLDRLDLLAHSAGTNLAVLYASRHPERVRRLALITPSTRAVGMEVTGESRLETARLRKNEPWYGPAFETLEAMVAGNATEATREAINPFFYGRWDAKAQTHQAAQDGRRNDDAAALFGAESVFNPDTTRTALATFTAPVLVLAGEFDLNTPPSAAAELATLFPNATFVIQPESGHFPWIDAAGPFVATTATFLD